MRLPVKLNNAFWPGFLRQLIGQNLRTDPRILFRAEDAAPNAADAKKVTEAISAMKFGTTFKTTADQRHRQADDLLLSDGVSPHEIILDIGASDGITSLNLIERLGSDFKTYFVTDYNLYTDAFRKGNKVFFFDTEDRCILIAGPLFVFYPQDSNLVRKLFQRSIPRLLQAKNSGKRITLIQPALKKQQATDPRIQVERYNIFEAWTGKQPTVVKVANVLNAGYFPNEVIIQALRNLHQTLPPGGRLLIVENRQQIQAGLYRREENGFAEISTVNTPDIHHLITGNILEAAIS
jgi:SAM-dependent methyltransferase